MHRTSPEKTRFNTPYIAIPDQYKPNHVFDLLGDSNHGGSGVPRDETPDETCFADAKPVSRLGAVAQRPASTLHCSASWGAMNEAPVLVEEKDRPRVPCSTSMMIP